MDKHPIKNDPFLFVADAFERLHPIVKYDAYWEREFDRIFDEYNKIMTELFDEEEQPIENENHA